jgi:hypothetical protein
MLVRSGRLRDQNVAVPISSTLAADYQYWISVSVPPDFLAPGEAQKSPG